MAFAKLAVVGCDRLMGRAFDIALLLVSLLATSDAARAPAKLTLLNADVQKYAPFIIKALYHERVAGTSLSALSETEKPINGDIWYWTDDNAKSLEALALAPVFPAFTQQVGRLVKFIIANSPPPFVFRRRTDERLEVPSANPEDFRVVTGLMNFHGNLRKGEVIQAFLAHDDRREDAVEFSADFLSYSVGTHRYSVDVAKSIDNVEIRPGKRDVFLVHKTPLRSGKDVVGNVEYSYRIAIDKPYVTMTLAVHAAEGITLTNVEATSAIDKLDSLSSVRYSKFFAATNDTASGFTDAKPSSEWRVLREGNAQWWAVIQNRNLGDSYGIATWLDAPLRLRRLVSFGEQKRAFRHIQAVYQADRATREEPLVISEKRVLLGGGLFDNMRAYDSVFSDLDRFPGVDLSISYDIGAELNGVAAAYLADKTRLAADPKATPVAYEPETRAWFDAIIEGYAGTFLSPIGSTYPYAFSRGTAFVLLAADTMFVATRDTRYLDIVRKLADVLLAFQSHHGSHTGAFGCFGSNDSHLDCHAATIVALARAAVALRETRYADAAHRGFKAYRVNTDADIGHDVFVRTRENGGDRDSYYWVYKAGMLLRSLESLEVLSERQLLKLTPADWEFMRALQTRTLKYIARTVHARGTLEEIFTCHRCAETNSETQAWALLGLYRVEHERTSGR